MAVYFTFRFFVVVGEEALPPSLVLIFTKKTGSLIGRQTGASQNCPLPLKSLARPPYVCHLRCPSTEVPQSHSMTKIRENIYIYMENIDFQPLLLPKWKYFVSIFTLSVDQLFQRIFALPFSSYTILSVGLAVVSIELRNGVTHSLIL